MRRTIISLLVYFILSFNCLAQEESNSKFLIDKPKIDTYAYNNWTAIERFFLNDEGDYCSYIIKNDPIGDYTMVLKRCKEGWEYRVKGVRDVHFSGDNQMALFMKPNDTLCIVRLGKGIYKQIPNVKSFEVPGSASGGQFTYFSNERNELVLGDIYSNEKRIYHLVDNFTWSEDGKNLIIISRDESESSQQTISWVEPCSNKSIEIWRGKGLNNYVLNRRFDQLAFSVSEHNKGHKSIWLFEKESGKLNILIEDKDERLECGLRLNYLYGFSNDSRYLRFTISPDPDSLKRREQNSVVTIWSYLDRKLQSQEQNEIGNVPVYYTAIGLQDRRVYRLEYDNANIVSCDKSERRYLISQSSKGASEGEGSWNLYAKRVHYIWDIDNNRKIKINLNNSRVVVLSPGGKYVVFFDVDSSNYFSYEIASGVCRNITNGIKVSWINSNRDDLFPNPRGIPAWMKADTALLIYDRFDIWKIDPSLRLPPVNLTNGYGLKNNIVFFLGLSEYQGRPLEMHETLILNAFNKNNMNNGYFEKKIGMNGDPKLLTMGNYIYQFVDNSYLLRSTTYPLKAAKRNRYIVKRMNAEESPNLFYTEDFKNFTRLSNNYPEKKYNWITTELRKWVDEGGKLMAGVLYKPENFDSTKKYPVIIHYYERKSTTLNEFINPEYITSGCNLNIPTFVSNDYLVFSPDIAYEIGKPMEGAYKSVTSAARYLSTMPFVRSNRIAIGGCSFGGLQTNYLITHSNLFAAAYSSSSMSDLISAYGDIPSGVGIQSYFETGGQGRIGGNLWKNREMYIENSPIFDVDKIRTPLLLMHTTHDGIYSFRQALELFLGMRRLGKRVWLLEYTEGNHGIKGKSAEDFGTRLKQFFDHYLRDTPAPFWMTKGIPTRKDDLNNSFDLDLDNAPPTDGLLKIR